MDDFFIGYDPPMPPALSRVVRRIAAVGVAGAALVGVGLAVGHVPLEGGSFAFGRPETVTGRLLAHPYPRIVPDNAAARVPLLVATGKHGAAPLLRGLDGRRLTFDATRISRDGHEMLEVRAGSIRQAGDDAPGATRHPTAPEGATPVELRGEIVDAKCYLGVMVPGEGRTHRACASLCLRGGIPAALRVRDASGRVTLYLLESPAGEPLAEAAAPWAGRAMVMSGVTGHRDGWQTLRTTPTTWRPAER